MIRDPTARVPTQLLWEREADIRVTRYGHIRGEVGEGGSDFWEGGGRLPTDWISIGSIIMKGIISGFGPSLGNEAKCVWVEECVFLDISRMWGWLIRRVTMSVCVYLTRVSSFFFMPAFRCLLLHLCLSPTLFRGCSSSETESEAGDLLDQQFEELNNKLNSVTDPTGFLRMVSRNNLFNR